MAFSRGMVESRELGGTAIMGAGVQGAGVPNP